MVDGKGNPEVSTRVRGVSNRISLNDKQKALIASETISRGIPTFANEKWKCGQRLYGGFNFQVRETCQNLYIVGKCWYLNRQGNLKVYTRVNGKIRVRVKVDIRSMVFADDPHITPRVATGRVDEMSQVKTIRFSHQHQIEKPLQARELICLLRLPLSNQIKKLAPNAHPFQPPFYILLPCDPYSSGQQIA